MLDLFDKYEFDASNHFFMYDWRTASGCKLYLWSTFGHISKRRQIPVIFKHQKKLAEDLGKHPRTIARNFDDLEKGGWLLPVKWHGRRGKEKMYIATDPCLPEVHAILRAIEALKDSKRKYPKVLLVLEKELSIRERAAEVSKQRELEKQQSFDGDMSTCEESRSDILSLCKVTFCDLLEPPPLIELRTNLFQGTPTPENEPKNLYPGLPGFVKKELSDWHESKSKPKTINTKTKKAAYRSSTPKKPKCKIEALLLRLNTKLNQTQIDDLVRIWSVYKPELALPHLEAKLKRFNKAKWYPKALHALWRKDGLIWHDADRGRYKDELWKGYEGPHDVESNDLVLAARKTPRKKYVKPPQVIKEPTPQKTWQVTMTFAEADEFQDLVETIVTSADSKAEAIERVRGWEDRTPINTIVTEVTK